jgi:hypothetical protein
MVKMGEVNNIGISISGLGINPKGLIKLIKVVKEQNMIIDHKKMLKALRTFL